MGCLFELVFEILLEGSIELLARCYIELLQFIIPRKMLSERAKKVIRITSFVFVLSLIFAFCVGLAFLIQSDPDITNIGRHIVRISLIVMAVQLVLGVLAWIIRRCRKSSGGKDGAV